MSEQQIVSYRSFAPEHDADLGENDRIRIQPWIKHRIMIRPAKKRNSFFVSILNDTDLFNYYMTFVNRYWKYFQKNRIPIKIPGSGSETLFFSQKKEMRGFNDCSSYLLKARYIYSLSPFFFADEAFRCTIKTNESHP